jgi:hypothetical protein
LLHRFSAGVYSGNSCPIENIDRSIVVPVYYKTAMRTGMYPVRKHLAYPFPAVAANNACMVWRHFLYPGTSVFSFVHKIIEQLAPPRIGYAFGKVVVLHHAADVQVLDSNEPVFVDKRAGQLMVEISPLIAYLMMESGKAKPRFPSVG